MDIRLAVPVLALQLVGCADEAATDRLATAASSAAAGEVIGALGSGTWEVSAPDTNPSHKVLRAWVDARVANVRYAKRVFVELDVPYENGSHVRTLSPASYEGPLGSGTERWGTDALEIYPLSGPNGSPMKGKAAFRLRLQHDGDGDGRDEMIVSDWQELVGEGALSVPSEDPWETGWDSPVKPAAPTPQPLQAWFAPFDDPGAVVLREIDAIREAKRAAPDSRHTIHAAVFNINDPRIVDRLIDAHREGVEVRLVTEGHKFRPSSTWQTGDDALLSAGVPLIGIMRAGTGAMHDKFVIFDGAKVATGSFNWESGSSFENHENMVLASDASLVAAYAQRFETIAGEAQRTRTEATDVNAARSAFFGPDEALHRVVGGLIDSAKKSLHIAMFTAKDFEFDKTSLLRKVAAAKSRGVDVRFITDKGIAEAGEYFGVETGDDQNDEWLESQGIHVILGDPPFAKYASMHHKFMVVDGETLVTGAFNWYYDAAFLNDEDVLVVRDKAFAARFVGEFADLARRYDPSYDPAAYPSVDVRFTVHHDGTVWGENVVLMGDLPELGAWSQGIDLDGASWPSWAGEVRIPAGVRMQFKFATRRADGVLAWESGQDRSYTVPSGGTSADAEYWFRR